MKEKSNLGFFQTISFFFFNRKIIFVLYFDSKENLVLLDLGCGNGVLSKRIASNYPKNEFHLMDGSVLMLEKAKQNFYGANVHYRHQSFEDYITSPANDALYDFVYSANAIHHLDFLGKSQMYAKIFSELKFDGLFLNFDPVLPSSERSEQWQFNMWTDWIKEYLQENGLKEDLLLKSLSVAEINAIPTNYKMKSENKPSNLFDQLQLLTKIGFKDVDCFYKYGIFALFGGIKRSDVLFAVTER